MGLSTGQKFGSIIGQLESLKEHTLALESGDEVRRLHQLVNERNDRIHDMRHLLKHCQLALAQRGPEEQELSSRIAETLKQFP